MGFLMMDVGLLISEKNDVNKILMIQNRISIKLKILIPKNNPKVPPEMEKNQS